MIDKFHIDTRDAYREFGIFLTDDSYNELLAFAPLKEVARNEWYEEDGVEVDLAAPVLNTRDVTLKFATHRTHCFGQFVALLSDKAYHTFDFPTIGRSYNLRLTSQSSLKLGREIELFTLKFANDFPLPEEYTYVEPHATMVPHRGYTIDGRSFADYGILILQGSDEQIRIAPPVKVNILQNYKSQHGAVVDDGQVNFQSKDVKLSCLMRASSLDEFWRNYNALFHDLMRKDERILYVESMDRVFPCYYKACSTKRFLAQGCIWFEFDLTLTFTSFRVFEDDVLLSTEEGDVVVTETEMHAIKLKI